jgi:hypothetical protein
VRTRLHRFISSRSFLFCTEFSDSPNTKTLVLYLIDGSDERNSFCMIFVLMVLQADLFKNVLEPRIAHHMIRHDLAIVQY